MALQVAELSLELIETLRPLVPRIKAKDRSLADQIMRSELNRTERRRGGAERPRQSPSPFLHRRRQRGRNAYGATRRDCLAPLRRAGRGGGGCAVEAHHRDPLETNPRLNG